MFCFVLCFALLFFHFIYFFHSSPPKKTITEDQKPVPIIRFSEDISSCSTEEGDGDAYLLVSPIEGLPDGYGVVDYFWEQTSGGEVVCVER